MIDRSHPLALTQQARELRISRGSVYYLPRQVAAADLTIMRRIDELHMDYRSPVAVCCEIFLLARVSWSVACMSRH